eukprot:scaffold37648_cov72-Phaeocystis_antarctica.AAC.1
MGWRLKTVSIARWHSTEYRRESRCMVSTVDGSLAEWTMCVSSSGGRYGRCACARTPGLFFVGLRDAIVQAVCTPSCSSERRLSAFLRPKTSRWGGSARTVASEKQQRLEALTKSISDPDLKYGEAHARAPAVCGG